MEYSEKFNKVRSYYKNGFWDEKRVRDAIIYSWITEYEFKEIAGKDY